MAHAAGSEVSRLAVCPRFAGSEAGEEKLLSHGRP